MLKKIIVVEDDPEWLKIIVSSIKRKNFPFNVEIETFDSYAKADEKFKNKAPECDLLIIDIFLDDEKPYLRDGLKLAEFVDSFDNIPVIVVTGVGAVIRDVFKNYNVIDVFDKSRFDETESEFLLSVKEALEQNKRTTLDKENKLFKIKEIDFNTAHKEIGRFLIFQLHTNHTDWVKRNGLYYYSKIELLKEKVLGVLNFSLSRGVNLVLLPELSVPQQLVPEVEEWSKANPEVIIVAGSHYCQTSVGVIARCPVITNGTSHYTEKIYPSPNELSSLIGDGLEKGKQLLYFKNTMVGDFFVLVCSDNLKNQEVRDECLKLRPDFVVVPAFQRSSNDHYTGMSNSVNNGHDLYYLYSNNKMDGFADGKSAFFGVVSKQSKRELIEAGKTDFNPEGKLCTLNGDENYCIIEASLVLKRPHEKRKVGDEPNVRVETGKIEV